MKKVFGAIGNYFRETDKLLLTLCLFACGYGLLLLLVASQSSFMQSSSTSALFEIAGFGINRKMIVQVGAVLLGVIAAIIISNIDYEAITSCWWIFVPIAVGLMIMTYFFGQDTGAADDKAWLIIPGIGIGFQPSELLKIAFIITFSLHLSHSGDHLNDPLNLVLLVVHGMIPVGLVALQGDDGTALVFVFIFLAMMFAAGVKFRYFVVGLSLVIVAIPLLWTYVLKDFQKERFTIFLHPESDPLNAGLQQNNARMMIGSWQLTGKGIAESGTIKLPERENDFIFSVAGETFGFLGTLVLILILVAILLRIMRISSMAKDPVGSYLCIGMFATLMAQIFINIGMNICLLPVIGVTLPFFSAGGSSTSTLFLGIGLVLSVYIHSRPKTYQEKLHKRYPGRTQIKNPI